MDQLLLFGVAADPLSGCAAPLLKWPGGKRAELPIVKRLAPTKMDRFFEPFVGGGAVYWSVSESVPALINDRCEDLVDVYRRTAARCPMFLRSLTGIRRTWTRIGCLAADGAEVLLETYGRSRKLVLNREPVRDLIGDLLASPSLLRELQVASRASGIDATLLHAQVLTSVSDKVQRMARIERDRGTLSDADVIANLEGAFKAALYTCLRADYNRLATSEAAGPRRTALFFFLREYAYAAMFRFNKRGEFNVPYGGLTYNSKDLGNRLAQMREPSVAARLRNTTIECLDFHEFMRKHKPQRGDFVFVDPPYDSDFSDYDGNCFDDADQERLARYLRDECPAAFLLVIQDSPQIRRLYEGHGLHIESFAKTYMWTIKSRNDRQAQHLAIWNY